MPLWGHLRNIPLTGFQTLLGVLLFILPFDTVCVLPAVRPPYRQRYPCRYHIHKPHIPHFQLPIYSFPLPDLFYVLETKGLGFSPKPL
ncbi:hypothetical protein Barb4_03236 [Bacteroidales bacterium Barb4]|nr:hypothetical protein Barb4_03236 [Bacteroidales bacterium Barb4]